MKRIVFGLLGIVLIASCTQQPDQYTVSGELQNGDGAYLYLLELKNDTYETIDSILLDAEGKFSFDGNAINPSFFLLRTASRNYIQLIIKNKENVIIRGNLDDLGRTYTVEGSADSKLLKELRAKMDATIDSMQVIGKILQAKIGTPEFNSSRDTLNIVTKKIFDDHRAYLFDFLEKNKTSVSCIIALYQQTGVRSFLIDFNKPEDFKYYEQVDKTLFELYPDSEPVQSFHRQIAELRRQILLKMEQDQKLVVGIEAPDIAMPNQYGDTILLSSLRGKYVLVDFWASWCSPCRRENPSLVRNYQKYKDKGFEIYQVSLDRTRDSWLEAIEKDNLTWIHVTDLKFWNTAPAKEYNVTGIPASFLLDKEGKIIAKNLRGEALDAKLSEIFN